MGRNGSFPGVEPPEVAELANLVARSERIVVFTGAGISTESGVPDFRSHGGLWERFRPVTIQEFMVSEEKRIEYWDYKIRFMESLRGARPGQGHRAIVELGRSGRLKGVITQNIDRLHQMAGTLPEAILELHGNCDKTVCLRCGRLRPWDEIRERILKGEAVPRCESCRGFLKPNTVSFGQSLDPGVLSEAFRWAKGCDLFLAVGSTLVVEPAASIPAMAKEYGAKLAILTLSGTGLDSFADLKVQRPIGPTLTQVVARLFDGEA